MDGLVKQKLLAVAGPTASGKTALAIHLARRFSGEIISADSMQIYKGLDVGTAKATAEEQALVPHHLLDFADPAQRFSVAAFLPMAQSATRDVFARGALPVLCGGTGLYISSLVNGITFTEEESDPAVRGRLQRQLEVEGPAAMLEKLAAVDPEYASKLHEHDAKRILRGLELYEKTGLTMSQQLAASRPAEKPYDALILAVDWPDRQALYARIEQRVDAMAAGGILEEARLVWQNKESWQTAAQAIGYKEYFPYFEGVATPEECTEKLKQATRNYAKRQLSWFRRMEEIHWVSAENAFAEAEALVAEWLAR